MNTLVSKLYALVSESSSVKTAQPGTVSSKEEVLLRDIESYYRLANSLKLKVDEIESEERKLILVADDEPLTCDLVEEFLDQAGIKCDVITAGNGDKAYNLATSFIPDLIITDWLMPELSGPELIVKLKDDPRTSEIPIILITGLLPSSDELCEVLDAGAMDYLRKPLDYTELKVRVKSALALNESIREARILSESISLKNRQIRFMLDAMSNPTFCVDGRGYVGGCNQSFEELAKKSTLELEGRLAVGVLPAPLASSLSSLLEGESSEETFDFSMPETNMGDQAGQYVVAYRTFGSGSERMLIGQVTEKTPRV